MPAPTVVILAAGHGTRMRSAVPKVLHPLCGRPLVGWPIAAARQAGAERVVVVDGPARALADHLPDGVEVAVQEEALGTADAVRAAAAHLEGEGPVLVLPGDVPLVTADLLAGLADSHARSGAAATLLTMELDDPRGYGRVVRDADGGVVRVAETKAEGDASPEELALREVSTSVWAFSPGPLADALAQVSNDNAQGEYYLPDVVPLLRAAGHGVQAEGVADPDDVRGINDRADLAEVRAVAQARILRAHMVDGVTVVDPRSTLVDVDVQIGGDAVVEPGCSLRGATRVGEGARVGPLSTLVDAEVAAGATVVHSYLHGCRVGEGATVGPFAYLRPGTVLGDRAKVGTFVEVKNSQVGAGAKVPHLSYVGDADVGEEANLGAGTITANYDGRAKHRTVIGPRARVSVDTSFVAPVELGEDAWTAAGSVISKDVPPGALGVARARQRNVPGYAERRGGAAPKEGEEPAEQPAPPDDPA